MFLVHRVVNGHPQYRITDTRNTFYDVFRKKYRVCHGAQPFWDLTDVFSPRLYLARALGVQLATTWPEYIGPRPKTPVSAPGNRIYYFVWEHVRIKIEYFIMFTLRLVCLYVE